MNLYDPRGLDIGFIGAPTTPYSAPWVTGSLNDFGIGVISGDMIALCPVQKGGFINNGGGQTHVGCNEVPNEEPVGEPIAVGPAPPPAPLIQGFAQLKYRPITWLEKLHELAPTHAFWYVDAFGGFPWILDGGPATKWVTLKFWATPGLVGHYKEDNVGATTWFDSGVSVNNTVPVFAMILFTKATGDTHLPYDVLIWDSNTAAHLIGLTGGFNPSRPPGALGW